MAEIYNSLPCVISGPGNTNLDHLASELGYQIINPQTNYTKWQSYLQKIPYYINIFYPEISIIILFLLGSANILYPTYALTVFQSLIILYILIRY